MTRTRRIGRQLAAIAAITLLGIAVTTFWRATSIRSLPRIADPFDRARDAIVPIPDDANAFTFYRRAYTAFKADAPRLRTSFYSDPSTIGDRELAILEDQREALELWLEGTKRDRALHIQPIDSNGETNLDVNQRLRNFSEMANLQAFRLQNQGDFAGAWAWLRANLRASRHSGMNGFVIERIIGTRVYEAASKQAVHWADDPKLDARLLRLALDDVLAIDAMTAPYRETVRSEFFATMNTLDDPVLRERLVATEKSTGKDLSGTFRNRFDARLATLFHEPERSRRVTRLVLANWLAACDLPLTEREARKVKIGKITLFRPGPGESAPISPEALAGWLDSSRYAEIHLDVWSSFADLMSRDERARAALIVHLAEELYRREHGRRPASIKELIGPYLRMIPDGYAPPDRSDPVGTSR